jgi:hypothetical protein
MVSANAFRPSAQILKDNGIHSVSPHDDISRGMNSNAFKDSGHANEPQHFPAGTDPPGGPVREL